MIKTDDIGVLYFLRDWKECKCIITILYLLGAVPGAKPLDTEETRCIYTKMGTKFHKDPTTATTQEVN